MVAVVENNNFGIVKAEKILPFFIFLIYLIPTFPEYTKAGLYFGTVIIILMLLMYVGLSFYAVNRINIHSAVGGLLVALYFLMLTILSIYIDIDRVIASDLIELLKPIIAFLVFIASYSIINDRENFSRYVVRPYSALFVIVAIMGILEAYFGFGTITHVLYTKSRAILQGKAVSPFGVTYFFASFMLFAVVFFISKSLVGSRHNLVYFMLCSIALLSSQSRTLFLAYAGSVAFFVTLYLFYPKFPSRFRMFLLMSTIAIFLLPVLIYNWDVLSNRFLYLYSGLSALFERGILPSAGGSANVRIAQIVWAYENNSAYGIVGTGIGKGYGMPLESFYAMYIYRYGFAGIAMYLFVAFFFLIKAYKAAKLAYNCRQYDAFSFFLAMHIFILLLPIASLSSMITDQYIFMFLYYGSLGFTLKYLDLKPLKMKTGLEK